MNYRFPKSEKLCGHTKIEELFKEGSSTFLYPFKLVYLEKNTPSETPPQILISVSKRNFKKAVQRNYIKRKAREAYRFLKPDFFAKAHPFAQIALLFVAKEDIPLAQIQRRMKKAFLKLEKEQK